MALFRFIKVVFAIILLLPHYAAAVQDIPRLTKLPLGERWYSISKEKEKTGFNRLDIRDSGGGYEIIVESGVKMTILVFPGRPRRGKVSGQPGPLLEILRSG